MSTRPTRTILIKETKKSITVSLVKELVEHVTFNDRIKIQLAKWSADGPEIRPTRNRSRAMARKMAEKFSAFTGYRITDLSWKGDTP